jgi:hypothetical protein
MAKHADPATELRWRQILKRQRSSGQSIRDFCQRQGLAESSFHFWRREVTRREQQRKTPSDRLPASGIGPAFLPVQLLKTPTEVPSRDTSVARLEIVLPDGLLVRILQAFEEESTLRALGSLLLLLREPPQKASQKA